MITIIWVSRLILMQNLMLQNKVFINVRSTETN